MVRFSPGWSVIRAKPLSSFTGRVIELTKSRTYICTTSSPAREPVFVTSTTSRVDSSRAMIDFSSRGGPNANVV